MAVNSGKAYTPEEDALILACPRVPGATRELAIRLGHGRGSVSMRRAQLLGTLKQSTERYHNNKPVTKNKKISFVSLPIARPVWFDEPELELKLVGQR